MEKREFDLFELIRILLKNRVFIIVFVAIVSVASVIYSLVTPEIWSSQATFYAVGESSSALPFNLPGLGGITSSFFDTGGGDQARNFVTVMYSRTFSEDVINRFDLIKYFKQTHPDSLRRMDRTLEKLRSNMTFIGYDDQTGLLSIRVESKDKKLSRDMVAYYLAKLEEYNREQKLTKGKLNRVFLEERINETRTAIDSLLLAVKDFQTQNKAVALEAQSEAMIESYSAVVAQKMALDTELELARQNYSADSPVVQNLETQQNELIRQIRQMERGGAAVKPEYMLNISSLPDLASRYAQLQLNLEIQSKVYEYLYPQYEAARLEELRDMPSLEIIDQPRLAGMRLRPRRAIICIISAFSAFVLACVLAIIKTTIQNNSERIAELKKEI